MGRKGAFKDRPLWRRLQTIHHQIKERRYPNATGLAKVLDVSTKTVQRDLDYLRNELAAPIEFDRDNNGYLDMAEAMASPAYRNLFKLMDRDGDGKLFEKEMFAYLDEVQELQTRAAASCVSLRVADEGRGLFDLLDTNRDGFLSLREMRNAPKLVDQLDRNGDGSLSRDEIPKTQRLTLARIHYDVERRYNDVVFDTPGSQLRTRAQAKFAEDAQKVVPGGALSDH